MTKTAHHNLAQSGAQHYRQTDHITAITTTLPSPRKDLAFPLNAYAHALLLQEGKATYPHYGLFHNETTSLQAAQQVATNLLLTKLPAPPCRILEVGIGLGSIFPLLSQQGYAVDGIAPDDQQITYIQKSLSSEVSVSYHSLEDFEAPAESFDVILFQESAQHIEPLTIFNKALDLLPLSGDLVIIDEFALEYDEAGTERLHLLNNMVALAERFGFELIEHVDLSTMAAPTLDYLLRITQIHQQRLIQDLSLSDEQLAQLDTSNRIHHSKYASGHYGYALLHFRKKTMPKWHPRILAANQMPQMLDLFKKTFNHDMTPATWQWKYGSDSAREIGVWRENQLIAHYGGIGREILFFGQPQTAVQIGDVMVDASERGTLSRKGPFFLMAATFLERYIGYGKPYLVGFGFPNERAMKVAERLGLYAEVGRMVEFSWQPQSRFPLWGTRLQLIDREQTDFATTAVNECWQRMAADMPTAMIGVRDWHYLQYRYLNHPNQHYQVMLVRNRFGGQVRGVLVLRHDPHGCEIIDIIAPLNEISLLVLHARRLAGINGDNRLFCRITENFAAHFTAAGGIRQSLDIRIPASTWGAVPSADSLHNRWWLMSGDTDFR